MEFDKLLYAFPSNLEYIMSNISDDVKKAVYEIRIRCDKPIILHTANGVRFLKRDGQVSLQPDSNCVFVGVIEMEVIFSRLCEQSLYSHENTIKNGYIPLRNGCRAGICGDFSDSTYNLRSVSSINLRIAREIANCDEYIFELMDNVPQSILIAGSPGSGKTTVLRELSRHFSDMHYCVNILDERGELAGMYDSKPTFNVGMCTDVISFRQKTDAANMAIKYMCPDIVAFDELSDDSQIMNRCAATGVVVFTTIHAKTLREVYIRLKNLGISRNCFDIIAVLDNSRTGNICEYVKKGFDK